jgi:hypothetical protein
MLTPIVLDFESFYDPETGYTLSKMPTQQYIRDKRFRCLGAGVTIGTEPVRWYEPHELNELLHRIEWSSTLLICHNARFDYSLLRWHWPHLPKPAAVFCTRDMGRYLVSQGILPPEQRVALRDMAPLVGMQKQDNYAGIQAGDSASANAQGTSDAEATRRLFFQYAHLIPKLERGLIDLHARMQGDPLLHLDVDKLTPVSQARPDPLAEILRSKDKFAEALRRCGVEPEMKDGKKGPQYAFAKTDAFMQDLLEHEDERVQLLANLRLEGSSNIVRTRAQRLLACGSPLGVPTAFFAAHTGRDGGTDGINLQNLPARNPDALTLRHSLLAPPGHSLIVVDSSQIEVRVNMWNAGEKWLLNQLANGADPYTAYAQRALMKQEILPAERQWAKAPVLAFGFAQGGNGYERYCQRSGISITNDKAHEECRQYRAIHPEVVKSWKLNEREALTGEVLLPSGRKLIYPEVRSINGEATFVRPAIFTRGKNRTPSKLWHGLATENRIQAIARDVVMEQIMVCVRQGLPCAMKVHDEAVFVVKDEDAADAKRIADKAFSTPPQWAPDLPVAGTAKILKRYSK